MQSTSFTKLVAESTTTNENAKQFVNQRRMYIVGT